MWFRLVVITPRLDLLSLEVPVRMVSDAETLIRIDDASDQTCNSYNALTSYFIIIVLFNSAAIIMCIKV